MAAVFFWNAINTPKKIFITWNPIAGTSQIKDEEDDRFGNSSVAIKLIHKGNSRFIRRKQILTWI